MLEDITPAPLDPSDEDYFAQGYSKEVVADWIDQPSSTCVSNRINTPKLQSWVLDKRQRLLSNTITTIKLTRFECILVEVLTCKTGHVVSNGEFLTELNKCTDNYKGLRMCLSRLQAKFKRATEGDNLFRPVRNRGYRLTQSISLDAPQGRSSRC